MLITDVFNTVFTIRQPIIKYKDKMTSYTYTKIVSQNTLEDELSTILALNDAFEDFAKNSLYPIDIILLNSIFLENGPFFENSLELKADTVTLFERLNRLGYSWSFYDIEARLLHLSSASIVLESKETYKKKEIKFFDKKSIKGGKIKFVLSDCATHLIIHNKFINTLLGFEESTYETAKDKLKFLNDGITRVESCIFKSKFVSVDKKEEDEESEDKEQT